MPDIQRTFDPIIMCCDVYLDKLELAVCRGHFIYGHNITGVTLTLNYVCHLTQSTKKHNCVIGAGNNVPPYFSNSQLLVLEYL